MTNRQTRKAIARTAVAIASSLLVLGITRTGVVPALTQEQEPRYLVVELPPLGPGISEGRHVTNTGVVSGLSDIAGPFRRATIWIDGQPQSLGTLGGPHSALVFTDFPHGGPIVGISETGLVDDRNEAFSCSTFFPGGREFRTGFVCRGFVSDGTTMKPLDTLGGPYSFAAGANTRGQVVGWAQTDFEDEGCVDGTIHQFLPVIWDGKTGQVTATLPTYADDAAGAAVAINDRGQVVGISGDCDQAVGRKSARHAIVWNQGVPADIGNLGADTWNTPIAINQQGDVVGFAGIPNGDLPVENFGAFIWTKELTKMQPLPGLGEDTHSEAWAINNDRQAVGVSCGAVCTAVLWENGRVHDLNELVPSTYGGFLRTARHINEAGMITGQAIDAEGKRVAYLAIPVE